MHHTHHTMTLLNLNWVTQWVSQGLHTLPTQELFKVGSRGCLGVEGCYFNTTFLMFSTIQYNGEYKAWSF